MSLLKPTSDTPAVYFKDLTIANIRCFKEEQTINFTNAKGEPAQWTVILGNNNTGKTTLLRCLYDLEQIKRLIRLHELSDGTIMISDKLEEPSIEYQPRLVKTVIDKLPKFISQSLYREANLAKNTSSFFIVHEDDVQESIKEGHGIDLAKNTWSRTLESIPVFNIDAYGIPRSTSLDINFLEVDNPLLGLKLVDLQKWLIEINNASKSENKEVAQKARNNLNQIEEILIDILPDVFSFRFQINLDFKNWVEFKTDYGWVRLKDLGYGYQSLMAWMVDFAKRLFDRYPESKSPLAEPAIALVDEIDLHLHPDWQRKVISHLSKHFPRTQFIVTAHSPLVIQSADEVNVVLLEADKENGRVLINQPEIENYQGWTVEEILTEIMGLGDKVRSDDYLNLMDAFDQALDDEDYDAAMHAYDALDKILHPYSNQRKLMKLQLTSIKPVAIAQ